MSSKRYVGLLLLLGLMGCKSTTSAKDKLTATELAVTPGQHDYERGVLFETGQHVAVDKVQAAVYYRRACEVGHLGACNNLAVVDASLVSSERQQLWQRACDGDLADGCFNLANDLLDSGANQTETLKHANALFTKACHLGLVPGCYNAGRIQQAIGEDPRDHYQKACDLNDYRSCYLLAKWQLTQGQNPESALQKGCELGLGHACAAMARWLHLQRSQLADERALKQLQQRIDDFATRACQAPLQPICGKITD